ncbi:putative membrane-bound spermidine synthase [Peribacillus sp. B2I2]|uniref:hypothetical protein n=1 Tax=Peribacillus sp. B2I2 TaxID=3156468 RepID=UPI0035148555
MYVGVMRLGDTFQKKNIARLKRLKPIYTKIFLSHSSHNTLEYNAIVPSFGLWGFHLASHFKLPIIIPSISVQHQALTSDMSNLFTIPLSIKEERGKAVMNSLKNLKLHKLYKNEIEKW